MGPILSLMNEAKNAEEFMLNNPEKIKELELLHPEYKETFQKMITDMKQRMKKIHETTGNEKFKAIDEQAEISKKYIERLIGMLQEVGYKSDFIKNS